MSTDWGIGRRACFKAGAERDAYFTCEASGVSEFAEVIDSIARSFAALSANFLCEGCDRPRGECGECSHCQKQGCICCCSLTNWDDDEA